MPHLHNKHLTVESSIEFTTSIKEFGVLDAEKYDDPFIKLQIDEWYLGGVEPELDSLPDKILHENTTYHAAYVAELVKKLVGKTISDGAPIVLKAIEEKNWAKLSLAALEDKILEVRIVNLLLIYQYLDQDCR